MKHPLRYLHQQPIYSTGGNELRVLIADDAEAVRKRLHELLNDVDGIDAISESATYGETIDSFHSGHPDVVVLDIRMPGGSGVDILKLIKQESPGTRVLIMTNYPYPQYRERCLSAGADYFFDKSNEFSRIAEVLKSLPGRRENANRH